MKKFFTTIRSISGRATTFLRASSVHLRALSVIVLFVLCALLYLYANHQSVNTFAIEYSAYDVLAAQADNAAYIPGAQNNPVRVALDQDLTEALDQSITVPRRYAAAIQGLADLKDSESQIDAISSTTDKVDIQIAKMQVDTLDNIAPSDKSRTIIALAKSRSSIIADIRAYSYRTDYEILQIFNRIISDKGVLSSAYVIELNNEIPTVESEFDKRSALYTQLENTAQQIGNIYADTPAPTPVSQGQ